MIFLIIGISIFFLLLLAGLYCAISLALLADELDADLARDRGFSPEQNSENDHDSP